MSDTPVRPTVEVTNYPKAGEPNPVATLGIVDVARWRGATGSSLPQYELGRDPDRPCGLAPVVVSEVFFQVTDREQTWMDMIAADADDRRLARLVFRRAERLLVRAEGRAGVPASDGAEFLWVSERDGFAHLYRYKQRRCS